MNLFETLKQFKNIEPDPLFTEKSKRAILAFPQLTPVGMKMGIVRFIETGVAVVLAGFFILLITGGFTGQQLLAPVQYSVIDPQGLRAEAQAIDMQIRLASVNYTEVTSTAATTQSTPAIMGSKKGTAPLLMAPASSTASTTVSGGAKASSTASSTLSIDQALQELSQ